MVLQHSLAVCLILVPIFGSSVASSEKIFASAAQNFILEGKAVTQGEFPFFASLEQEGEQYCAGTLITRNWILTSGDCANDLEGPVRVKLGVITNKADVESLPITQVFLHEKMSSTKNNIALMKFDGSALKFNKTIRPVSITQNAPQDNQTVTLVGFSRRNKTETPTGYSLYKVKEKILDNANCKRQYGGVVTFTNQTLCARGDKGLEGGCNEDLGSPLVIASTKELVGIYYIRYPCIKYRPDVYTNVHTFLPWIKQTLTDNK